MDVYWARKLLTALMYFESGNRFYMVTKSPGKGNSVLANMNLAGFKIMPLVAHRDRT